jgi:hypothetical protein
MAYKDLVKKAEYDKAYYEQNREKIAAQTKTYREQNREKIAAQAKTYRKRNREKIAATKKTYREQNREKIAAQRKTYYERNREKEAAYHKAYREQNREKIVAQQKTYREQNREKIAAIGKNYRERNPEMLSQLSRKKRCAKRNATIPLSEKEREKLLLLESTRLELQRETGKEYHIDHILPIRYGGIHHPINLRILEGEENLSKSANILPEAIDLATEHFRLYNDRVSPERAWEFVQQLAEGLGFSEQEVEDMMAGKPIRSKPILEGFME